MLFNADVSISIFACKLRNKVNWQGEKCEDDDKTDVNDVKNIEIVVGHWVSSEGNYGRIYCYHPPSNQLLLYTSDELSEL